MTRLIQSRDVTIIVYKLAVDDSEEMSNNRVLFLASLTQLIVFQGSFFYLLKR